VPVLLWFPQRDLWQLEIPVPVRWTFPLARACCIEIPASLRRKKAVIDLKRYVFAYDGNFLRFDDLNKDNT
jgi:hypothetical protein